MSDSECAPKPLAAFPDALWERVQCMRRLQVTPDFSWKRVGHLRHADIDGLRFYPSMGDVVSRMAARQGWFRWIGAPIFVVPCLLGRDIWVGIDPLWLKLLYSVPLLLVALLGAFVFWALGPDRSVKIGTAKTGIYLTPELFTLWTVNDAGGDHYVFVPRAQVLRFESRSTGSGNGPSLWVHYQRLNGEIAERRTGLPGTNAADHTWLERWRTTGEL